MSKEYKLSCINIWLVLIGLNIVIDILRLEWELVISWLFAGAITIILGARY